MKLSPHTLLFTIHDLSCALGELGNAARRLAITRPPTLASDLATLGDEQRRLVGDLAVAAVAFTVQLAIEVQFAIETGRDPAQMRDLERELIATLRTHAEHL